MDVQSVLQTLLGIVIAILSGVWSALGVIFGIPVIGSILQTAFYVGTAYVLYRYSPAFVRRGLREKALPIVRSSSKPVRWVIVRALAEPEWLAQRGSPAPHIITREVVITRPLWRTRMRWALTGIIATIAIQQHALYWPTVRSLLGI